VVLGAAVVLPWAKVASELVSPPAPPATARAEGVVWANRVFVDRAALGVWLRSRGASYDEWACTPPTLAGTTSCMSPALSPSRAVTPASAASAQAPDGHARRASAQEHVAVGGSPSWVSRLAWLVLALVLTAGLGVAVFRSLERVSDEEDEDDALRIEVGELREPGGGGGPAQPMRVRSSASWR